MNVEKAAVNKLESLLLECRHLDPYIDTNDRTPFTDGHIEIYSSGSHEKRNFIGKVSVQVKGRTIPKSGKWTPSIPISRVDVDGYLKEGGVLYFVVFVNPRTRTKKPFYTNLSPYRIRDILGEIPATQKEVTVPLKKMPSDPTRIENLVHLAHQTQKEILGLKIDNWSLEDPYELSIITDEEIDLSEPFELIRTEHDFTVLYKYHSGLELPASGNFEFIPESYRGITTKAWVQCGEFSYRNPVVKKTAPNAFELQLSPSFILSRTTEADGILTEIRLTADKNLGQRMKDLFFVYALKDLGGMYIDENFYELGDQPPEDNLEMRENFDFLRQVAEAFEELEIDPFLINLEDVSAKELQNLGHLAQALKFEFEMQQGIKDADRTILSLGPWRIDILRVQVKASNKWFYKSLFSSDLDYQLVLHDESGGDAHRVTAYDVLDAHDFACTLNLSLGRIVDAYDLLEASTTVTEYATRTVTNLISAGDKIYSRRSDFLEAAEKLNHWILSKNTHDTYALLNKWQIALRNGPLTKGQRNEIRELKRSATRREISDSKLIEVACALLLDEDEEVVFNLKELSKAEAQLLQTWPIWKLYSRTTHAEIS